VIISAATCSPCSRISSGSKHDDPVPALDLFRRKAMILIDDVALDANLSTDEAARATEALVRRGAPGLNFDGRVLAFLQPARR